MAGSRYVLTDPDAWQVKLSSGGLRGQTTLILKELIAAHPSGLTSAEVTELIKDRIVTRQPVERVVGFYFSVWKKAGHIRQLSSNVAPDAEDATIQAAIGRSPGPNAEQSAAVEFIPADPDEDDEDLEENDEEDDDDEEDDELLDTLSKTEKLHDAILAVIDKNSGANNDDIITILNEHWRTGTARKQVNDTLLKMAKADTIRRHEKGGFYIPTTV
jgi:hypothetical protein